MLDKKHKYYLSRINKLLNGYQHDILIGLINIGGVEGFSTDEQAVIDPRGQLLPTLIHECLHMLYQSWPEDKVVKTEETLVKNMSAKQFQNLLIKLSYKI